MGSSHSRTAGGERVAAPGVSIKVEGGETVSGLYRAAARPIACYVFAHGAGAGMAHPFMEAVSEGLAKRNVGTLRYPFPYMGKGGQRADPPKLAHATVRAAVAEAGRLAKGVPLIAGGKSFGGRMTSQAQALEPLPGVVGLAFLGFPLRPAGKPSDERATHLFEVKIPMLFLQGPRAALAELSLLEPLVKRLGKRATLKLFDDADHSFHVPARTGREDAEVRAELLDVFAGWIGKVVT